MNWLLFALALLPSAALLVSIARHGQEKHALLSEIQQLQADRLLIQDRLEQAINDRAWLRELMTETLKQKDDALHTQINILMQKEYGIAPFPDATKLPESRVPQVQEPTPILRRMTGGEAVRAWEAKFRQEIKLRMKQQAQKQAVSSE